MRVVPSGVGSIIINVLFLFSFSSVEQIIQCTVDIVTTIQRRLDTILIDHMIQYSSVILGFFCSSPLNQLILQNCALYDSLLS